MEKQTVTLNRPDGWAGQTLSVPGWIRIFRPLNLFIVFVGCVVGSMLVHGASISSGDLPYLTAIAGLSAVLMAGFGNISNDMIDLKIDRINRPDRPLPAGSVSLPVAGGFALICFVGSVLVARSLSLYHVAVVLTAGVLLLIYNWILKRYGLLGTIVISSLVAMAVGFGALTGASSGGRAAAIEVIVRGNVMVTMGFAFVLTLARELVKDIQDMPGDLDGEIRSMPLKIGGERTGRVVRVLIAATILGAPMPYLLGGFSGLYLLMMIPVVALLVRILAMLGDVPPDAALISRHLKLSMILGLFALASAAVWPV